MSVADTPASNDVCWGGDYITLYYKVRGLADNFLLISFQSSTTVLELISGDCSECLDSGIGEYKTIATEADTDYILTVSGLTSDTYGGFRIWVEWEYPVLSSSSQSSHSPSLSESESVSLSSSHSLSLSSSLSESTSESPSSSGSYSRSESQSESWSSLSSSEPRSTSSSYQSSSSSISQESVYSRTTPWWAWLTLGLAAVIMVVGAAAFVVWSVYSYYHNRYTMLKETEAAQNASL